MAAWIVNIICWLEHMHGWTAHQYPIITAHNYGARDTDKQSISGNAFTNRQLQIPPQYLQFKWPRKITDYVTLTQLTESVNSPHIGLGYHNW